MRIKLQFVRIGVNLLGSFLTDFRNSRGKFDEIKEEFVINPAPIPSELSLNAGESWWTKDLPINSLNSFTNRSKVKKKGRSTWVFKERIGPKIVGNWRGCGGVLQGSWERFHLARMLLQFRNEFHFNFASTRAQIVARSGHDRATIRSRLSVDRGPRSRSAAVFSS